jgi:hypothetical protein
MSLVLLKKSANRRGVVNKTKVVIMDADWFRYRLANKYKEITKISTKKRLDK